MLAVYIGVRGPFYRPPNKGYLDQEYKLLYGLFPSKSPPYKDYIRVYIHIHLPYKYLVKGDQSLCPCPNLALRIIISSSLGQLFCLLDREIFLNSAAKSTN